MNTTLRPATAVIATCSANRWQHLLHQQAALHGRHPEIRRIVVWLDAQAPPELPGAAMLHIPPGRDGLRLSAARNAGAAAAIADGATLLIFLDADCVPGPDLIERYQIAAQLHPRAILCGPVTYLPESFPMSDTADLAAATKPHSGRPAPSGSTIQAATQQEYALFWSLSFAINVGTWHQAGGFDERYQGYGGEDTDFAWKLKDLAIDLYWVGGADAYHQYHPTASPPWQNLTDIVRNANLFFDRWEQWPMLGWLDQFEKAGAVRQEAGRYRLLE